MKDAFNKLRKSSTDTTTDWDGDGSNGVHFRKSVLTRKRQPRPPHLEPTLRWKLQVCEKRK